MLMSPKIREMTFNEAPDANQIRRAAIGEGMKTLYRDGIEKVFRGVTTLEEVLRVAKRPRRSDCRIDCFGGCQPSIGYQSTVGRASTIRRSGIAMPQNEATAGARGPFVTICLSNFAVLTNNRCGA